MHSWLLRPLLGLLLVASAGATWYGWAWWSTLPPPRDATRDELLRWVVQRDLRQESASTRRELVDRWQEELLLGMQVGSAAGWLGDSQRQQIAANAELLQHDWFLARCEAYAALPAGERIPFLDRQIATVAQWQALETEFAADRSVAASDAAPPPGLFARLDGWIAAAAPDQRPRLETALADSLVRWLMTVDLAAQSPEVVATLADRVAHRLDRGEITRQSIDLGGSPAERERLRANGWLLLEGWFGALAADYERLPTADKLAFLDTQVDRWQKWDLAALLTEEPRRAAASPIVQATEAMKFAVLFQERIAAAPAAEQARRRALFDALQARVVWRWLPRWPAVDRSPARPTDAGPTPAPP